MAITKYRTKYGPVYHSSTCKDDYDNIKTVTLGPGATYTLQAPAIRSLRVVARQLGHVWKSKPVMVTGTIRTCKQQAAYYASDPTRYASPNGTLHTQGLAIDVHTGHLNDTVRKALLAHGWHQSRPDDEPWHFSYKLTA